jgi:hypothetical protein
MDVTDQDIKNLRRISEQVFDRDEYIDIVEVKDAMGNVMVRVKAADPERTVGVRNAFAGDKLRAFIDNGYVAVAIGGDDETHTAWFERADAVEFGEPQTAPEGGYDLREDYTLRVGGDRAILSHDGSPIAHIGRDGWTLDEHVMYKVLPSGVAQDILDLGFEKGDVEY